MLCSTLLILRNWYLLILLYTSLIYNIKSIQFKNYVKLPWERISDILKPIMRSTLACRKLAPSLNKLKLMSKLTKFHRLRWLGIQCMEEKENKRKLECICIRACSHRYKTGRGHQSNTRGSKLLHHHVCTSCRWKTRNCYFVLKLFWQQKQSVSSTVMYVYSMHIYIQ